MSKEIATSIARNATVMMGSQVVTWTSTVILMVFLPRYLGSEDYGRLFLAMSLAMIAQVFVDFGGSYFIPKEVARNRSSASTLIADSVGLRLLLAVISIAALATFAWVAGYPWHVRALILILAVAKLWEGPLAVMVGTFQGFEQMRHRSLLSIIEKVFVTSAGLVALALGGSSLSIALLMSGGTLLSALVGVTRLRTLVGKLPRVQWRRMGELARTGTPYLMMAIFAVIYYRINAVMLSLLVSEQVVGWFGAAFRFFDILMFLPSILSMAVFPVLARTAGQKGVVTQTTVKSLEFIILSAIPLAVGTLSFSDDIIGLLFGARAFAGSAAVLRTLAPGLILVYVDFVLVTALIAMDRQKQWSYVACAAIPASIALNALLIPYFQRHTGNGGIGSAIATNITEFGILLSALWLLPRGFFPRERTWHVVKTLFAGGAMFGAIKLFRMIGVPWPVQALAGAMAYAVSILSTRVFHNDELAFVRAFITPSGLRRLFASEKAGPS